MIAARIEGFTRELGKPDGWDNQKHGHCGCLPVKDVESAAGNQMISAWVPTPDELAKLAAGAPVYLGIVGGVHPPVWLAVGEAPE